MIGPLLVKLSCDWLLPVSLSLIVAIPLRGALSHSGVSNGLGPHASSNDGDPHYLFSHVPVTLLCAHNRSLLLIFWALTGRMLIELFPLNQKRPPV